MELSEKVQHKLAEAFTIWADENLIENPVILRAAIYFSLRQTFIEKVDEIEKTFGVI